MTAAGSAPGLLEVAVQLQHHVQELRAGFDSQLARMQAYATKMEALEKEADALLEHILRLRTTTSTDAE